MAPRALPREGSQSPRRTRSPAAARKRRREPGPKSPEAGEDGGAPSRPVLGAAKPPSVTYRPQRAAGQRRAAHGSATRYVPMAESSPRPEVNRPTPARPGPGRSTAEQKLPRAPVSCRRRGGRKEGGREAGWRRLRHRAPTALYHPPPGAHRWFYLKIQAGELKKKRAVVYGAVEKW